MGLRSLTLTNLAFDVQVFAYMRRSPNAIHRLTPAKPRLRCLRRGSTTTFAPKIPKIPFALKLLHWILPRSPPVEFWGTATAASHKISRVSRLRDSCRSFLVFTPRSRQLFNSTSQICARCTSSPCGRLGRSLRLTYDNYAQNWRSLKTDSTK